MKFTADNLKTCDVVEFRNGKRSMVFRVFDDRLVGRVVCSDNPRAWLYINLDEDMCWDDGAPDWDVVKVYRPQSLAFSMQVDEEELRNWGVVWVRPKEISREEALRILEEKFGCPVEIME